MKTIVKGLQPTNQVDITSINNDSIIGVLWKNGVKDWVAEVKAGEFTSVGLGEDTDTFITRSSKQEYCLNMMDNNWNVPQMFLFNNKEELVDWLKQ